MFDARNVDCLEEQYPCTNRCERGVDRDYILTREAKHNGKACIGPFDCQPGDGGCPTTTTTATSTTVRSKATVAIAGPVETVAETSGSAGSEGNNGTTGTDANVKSEATNVNANSSSNIDANNGGSSKALDGDTDAADAPNNTGGGVDGTITDAEGGDAARGKNSAGVPVVVSLFLLIVLVIILVAWRRIEKDSKDADRDNDDNKLDLSSYSHETTAAAIPSFANAKQKRGKKNAKNSTNVLHALAPLNRPPISVPTAKSSGNNGSGIGMGMSHDAGGYLEPALVILNPAYAEAEYTDPATMLFGVSGAVVDADEVIGAALYEEPVADNPLYGDGSNESDYAGLVGHGNDPLYAEDAPSGFEGVDGFYADATTLGQVSTAGAAAAGEEEDNEFGGFDGGDDDDDDDDDDDNNGDTLNLARHASSTSVYEYQELVPPPTAAARGVELEA